VQQFLWVGPAGVVSSPRRVEVVQFCEHLQQTVRLTVALNAIVKILDPMLASWAAERGYEDLLRLRPKDITRKLLEVPGFAEGSTFGERSSPREYTGIRFVRES